MGVGTSEHDEPLLVPRWQLGVIGQRDRQKTRAFCDNKVWVTCWNGGWVGTANLVGDATNCPPGWPAGNAWVVFDDNKVWVTCWNGG